MTIITALIVADLIIFVINSNLTLRMFFRERGKIFFEIVQKNRIILRVFKDGAFINTAIIDVIVSYPELTVPLTAVF